MLRYRKARFPPCRQRVEVEAVQSVWKEAQEDQLERTLGLSETEPPLGGVRIVLLTSWRPRAQVISQGCR